MLSSCGKSGSKAAQLTCCVTRILGVSRTHYVWQCFNVSDLCLSLASVRCFLDRVVGSTRRIGIIVIIL